MVYFVQWAGLSYYISQASNDAHMVHKVIALILYSPESNKLRIFPEVQIKFDHEIWIIWENFYNNENLAISFT